MPEIDDAFQDMSVPIPEQETETTLPPEPPEAAPSPPKPKPDFFAGVLGLVEQAVYARAGVPSRIATQAIDPAARKVVVDMLGQLGIPRLNTDGLSPTTRNILAVALLGGYGYLVYSQAKMLGQAISAQQPPKQNLQAPSKAPTMKPEDKHEHKIPDSGNRIAGTASEGSSTGTSPGSI